MTEVKKEVKKEVKEKPVFSFKDVIEKAKEGVKTDEKSEKQKNEPKSKEKNEGKSLKELLFGAE